MNQVSTNKLNRLAWIISAIIIIIHFLPYVLLWDNAYVRLHDTLEGEWIWLHVLKQSGVAWQISSKAHIAQVMNGIPRNAFPSAYNLNYLFVEVFGTYWGYIINRTFIHFLGFFGMYILLKNHFGITGQRTHIAILVALAFSLVPVFSVFGITVMGQPLLLYVFLTLLHKKAKVWHWIYLCLYPAYSSLVWGGLPVVFSLCIIALYHYAKSKTFSWQYLVGICILVVVFIMANLSMFMLILQPDGFVPHRIAYNLYLQKSPELWDAMLESLMHFFINHYHVGTFLTLPILLAILISTRFYSRKFQAIGLLWAIILISLFQGFYSYIEYYLGNYINFLRAFRLNRFSILLPTLWLIAFAISLLQMYNNIFRKLIYPFLIAQLLIILTGNDEVIHNYRMLLGIQKFPTFKQYMAEEQFEEVKKYINKDVSTYRVVSLGFCPTITQYNGFYTLDSYQTIYDLNYKNSFRKIIENELKKNDDIRYYFDGWGNRCYLYCSELGKEFSSYMVSKYDMKKILNLNINTNAMKQLGGYFVISSVEIVNPEDTGLELKKIFENKNSWWNIYLYSIKNNS